MYCIHRSVDIDFSHHVRGHLGGCINVHGHTWKFEVGLSARELDKQGFVVDFGDLERRVLVPCHDLLDHGFAVGEATYVESLPALTALGQALLSSRSQQPEAPFGSGIRLYSNFPTVSNKSCMIPIILL